MELKTSMTLIPFLDQWQILRIWSQPYMTEVSCTSKQSHSVKKMDLHFVHLAVPPWCHWAGSDGGASKGYKAAPQQRELRDCHLLPFGSGAVLKAGQRAQGATAANQGSCMSSARRMFVGGGLAPIHAPWGLSYGHWKAGIKLRCSSVWLNMREHMLLSCTYILALMSLCFRPNVCSGVSS